LSVFQTQPPASAFGKHKDDDKNSSAEAKDTKDTKDSKDSKEIKDEEKYKESSKEKAKDEKTLGPDTNSAPCVSWISPLLKPKLALLCIHGLGLYSNDYANFGQKMAMRGINTYAIDVRGFGSWMKSEGHENVDFKGCLEDIHVAL